MPAYVEREFRHYLDCGILAYGFAPGAFRDITRVNGAVGDGENP